MSENRVNCSICLDAYTDPKILQCFHVFCQRCLVNLVVQDQQVQLFLSCPVCRHVTPVPVSGTPGLQSAFSVFNRLQEALKIAKPCSEHNEREVELFCETCGELICYKCALKDGRHHNHDYNYVNESFERYREDIVKCVATGRGTREAVVGEVATIALTFEGLPLSPVALIIFYLQVELVSEITGGRVLGSVKRSGEQRGQGQYVISYQPTVNGRHQLHIKAGGQHIRGSPFRITVMLPVEKLGTPMKSLHGLIDPWGVTVNGKGELVVAEHNADRVSVFSPRGEKLKSFGVHGSGGGRFDGPSDVAVDGEGNLLVLEQENCRIQKFTADGNFLEAVGRCGSGPLEFCSPIAITYSASNNKVYVVDTGNNRVQILTPDLGFVSTFGNEGDDELVLDCPNGISTDCTGRVYVADNLNHCIKVFTAEGRYLKTFGREGAGRGELNSPWGVGVDNAYGLVYVSEEQNHRVSVFTSEGKFVTAFGSEGTGPGQFSSPAGLVVDDSGVVYVCDGFNNVHMF